MVFIIQPTEEGQTQKCPNCDVDLVGRLTDYKGRFPDKLLWQSKSERKAHYDKDGNCKDAEGTTTPTPNTKKPTLDESLVRESKSNSQDEDVRYIKNKVDLMFAMISEQFRDYIDRKNHS